MNYFDTLDKQGYYIIAEIGVNYYDIAEKNNISLVEAAKLMMNEAKLAGADAAKFQTYTAAGLASKYSPSKIEVFTKADWMPSLVYGWFIPYIIL